MVDHKLEFFKIKLRPTRPNTVKTFRDFCVDVLGSDPEINNVAAAERLFEYFIECLGSENTHDKRHKKKIEFFDNDQENPHFDRKPRNYPRDFVIRGVLDGGPYGVQRLIRDIEDPETASRVTDTNVVASYFYVYIYLPPDNNVGCFGVHSHGSLENNAGTFRRFMKMIFKGPGYYGAETTFFCPKEIQDSFLNGGIVSQLKFTKSSVPLYHQNQGVREELGLYKVTVTATPLNTETSAANAKSLSDKVGGYEFGIDETDDEETFLTLSEFETKTVQIDNDIIKQSKSFSIDNIADKVRPSINLNVFLELGPNEEPTFLQIDEFCDGFFKETILAEIREDQAVRRL